MEDRTLAIDIGGTYVKIATVKQGQIENKTKFAFARDVEKFMEELKKAVSEITTEDTKISSIGIGSAGIIRDGVIMESVNLGWKNVPLVELIKNIYNCPVYISNDANVATLAEVKEGAGKGKKHVIMLTLGTGVGGGIVIDGKMYEGNKGGGAEIGHSVVRVGGRKCSCGRRGCVERYVSTRAFVKDARKILSQNTDSPYYDEITSLLDNDRPSKIFGLANRGNELAIKIVDKYIKYLGEFIINICNVFRPETIILGGGISVAGNELTDRLIAYCKRNTYGMKGCPEVDIVTARLNNDAGLLGAYYLTLN